MKIEHKKLLRKFLVLFLVLLVTYFFDNTIDNINLTDNKNVLREPYVRHISIPKYKELYELRIRTAKTMARTIFTVSGENIVLLYAFQKKCKRDNVKALECAYKMNKTSEELTEVCL